MARQFAHENGFHYLVCACGARVEVGRGGGRRGGRLPPDAVARMFSQKGWLVGSAPRKDRCPECLRPARSQAPMEELLPPAPPPAQITRPPRTDKPNIRLVQPDDYRTTLEEKAAMPQTASTSTDTAKSPSREDRRLIFAQLEEVYVSEKVGYKRGWSDQKVAEHMQLPIEWVAEVRDANFGPDTNEAAVELREIVSTLELTQAAMEEQEARIEELAEANAELQRQNASLQRQLMALQARYKENKRDLDQLLANARRNLAA